MKICTTEIYIFKYIPPESLSHLISWMPTVSIRKVTIMTNNMIILFIIIILITCLSQKLADTFEKQHNLP